MRQQAEPNTEIITLRVSRELKIALGRVAHDEAKHVGELIREMIRERIARRRDRAGGVDEDRAGAVVQQLGEGHSPFLDRVAGGEHFVVSKDDKPVAKLVGADGADRERTAAAVRRLRELRNDTTLAGLTWKELRDAGRR